MPIYSIYTAEEVCPILTGNTGNLKGLVGCFILKILIPVNRSRIYRLLTCSNKDQDVCWKSRGQLAIIADNFFDSDLKKYNGNKSQVVSMKYINNIPNS